VIKAIIVEDELKSRNNLKNFLQQFCSNVDVVAEAGDIATGVKLIEKHQKKLDLAFLDISLPDGLVFQLLDQIKDISFDIIFLTAYEKYARKACNYSSIGYVMKPIVAEELQEAVSRIKPDKPQQIDKRLQMFKEYYNNPNSFSKMSIAALDGIYFVKLKEIVRFEAEDNYTHIFLNTGEKLTASKTIKSYEENLSHLNFYRVHKSHLINLNYMRKFVKGDGGYLIMDDGKKIEVSRRRRPAFMEQMRRLQEGI